MRIGSNTISVLSLLFGPLLSACATTSGAGDTASPALGRPIPDLQMTALTDGAAVNLASFRGKVVLLDIWASWCVPCKEEMPLLDDMARRLGPQGLQVIAVSIDEDRANAQAFLRTRDSWSLLLAHDPAGKVPDALQPPKMPTSYVVDAAGIVRHVNAGFQREDMPRLEARVTELLQKK